MKGKLDICLAGVFRLAPEALTEEAGFRLHAQALQGHTPGRLPAQYEEGWRKAAKVWAEGRIGAVSYAFEPNLGGANFVLQIFWAGPQPREGPVPLRKGDTAPPTLRIPVQEVAGGRIVVITAHHRYTKDEGAKVVFFRRRLEEAFDVLRPIEAYADTYRGGGFQGERDPFEQPHWLVFLPPGRAEMAERLHERLGAVVEKRGWGGFVVECWENPFQPPAGARRIKL